MKKRHPEIPWRQVYGFGKIAARAYEEIELARMWEVVRDYLPAVKVAVEQELKTRAYQDLSESALAHPPAGHPLISRIASWVTVRVLKGIMDHPRPRRSAAARAK